MTEPSTIISYYFSDSQSTTEKSKMTAKEFMLSGTSGVYTSMRTVDGHRLFLFDDHMQRMVDSLNKTPGIHSSETKQYWATILLPLIRKGLNTEYNKSTITDSRIVVLIQSDMVRVHISKMSSPVGNQVLFTEGHRENPNTKQISWVHDRESFERLIVPPINEVVLVNEGRFLEGLSSNFFATKKLNNGGSGISSYKLVSAPLENILLGTVMKEILAICKPDGIEVSFDSSISDIDNWSSAFISSTSRLILPIGRIWINDRAVSLSVDPLVAHLQKRIRERTGERSVDAFSS